MPMISASEEGGRWTVTLLEFLFDKAAAERHGNRVIRCNWHIDAASEADAIRKAWDEWSDDPLRDLLPQPGDEIWQDAIRRAARRDRKREKDAMLARQHSFW